MENVAKEKRGPIEDVKHQVMTVAVKATEAERKAVNDLIARAKGADYSADVFTITPAMAALIFLEANPSNRDWQPGKTLEWARRMTAGQWRQNNQPPGFYNTGLLEDGQHRLAACALADYSWTTLVVFGVDPGAISTVDAGARRYGSDAAKLQGVADSKFKEQIIRLSSAYLVKRGDKSAALKSETEIAQAIKARDEQLGIAIQMAHDSEVNIVNQVLKPTMAAATAFIMLEAGWPEQRVREKLALLNSGQSKSSDSDPMFVAGTIIARAHEKSATKEKLTTAFEVGLILLVMNKTEDGTTAVQKKNLLSELKKGLPDPTYRKPLQQAA